MKYVCMALIRFYQRVLSPLKPYPTCRFYPSCSGYALEAFAKRGFFAGLALTVWRILRCSPLSPGGFDPVPETGFRTMPLRWSKYERSGSQAEDDGEPYDTEEYPSGDGDRPAESLTDQSCEAQPPQSAPHASYGDTAEDESDAPQA